MCQHSSARPAVQKAGGIIMLARLCDEALQPLEVVRNASAALASITVEAAAKVRLTGRQVCVSHADMLFRFLSQRRICIHVPCRVSKDLFNYVVTNGWCCS